MQARRGCCDRESIWPAYATREHGSPREEAGVLERELNPASPPAMHCACLAFSAPLCPPPPREGEPLLAWGLGVPWGDLLWRWAMCLLPTRCHCPLQDQAEPLPKEPLKMRWGLSWSCLGNLLCVSTWDTQPSLFLVTGGSSFPSTCRKTTN